MAFTEKEKNRLVATYGPWAVVTGASSGIGRELAVRLAEAGLNLVLTARREPLLRDLASELSSRFGIESRVVAADLSQPDEVNQVIAAAGNLDVGLLVAAAGFGTSGHFLQSSLPDELAMLQVNCSALLALTHHFSRKMAERGRGGIILLSSIVSFQGVPYAAHYAATKAYVQSLAEALALELRPRGVDVLAAAPAPVDSGFAAQANMDLGKMTLQPADIAAPILWALGRKTTVLPGFLTKFLVGSLRTVPRWAKVRIMGLVMGGMTRHQRVG